ncbi:MAG: peptide chain release factor N(5)-glutamine methyltransferase, partial [Candidatus Cloacimonetes bacterium]|nr:peptide chain release factor N(5)-glutamine methyltransferase [Candidatus Cloacimonadota bacterium]
MNIKEILKISGDFLSLKNLENPRFDCELLLSEYLECSRTELYLNADREISDLDKDNTRVLLDRRANYEPLQYIIGNVDFYGNKIFVDRNVLIPRPETEFLVDLILKENRHFNSILELGTGSGAIAVALKKELQNVRLDAVDISENILKIARQNAIFNNAEIN